MNVTKSVIVGDISMRELQLNFISNQTTIRWFNILNFIERNRQFTIGELAEVNYVSHRTIANDVKYLKEHFEESAIFHSGSNGFVFEETNLSLYQEQKKKLLENEILFKLIENIFYGKLDRIDELADYYNYSESTFRRLLSKCAPLLESYGLKWVSNPLNIEGDEACIRKFFKDFFYEGIETPYSVIPDQQLIDLVINNVADKLSIDVYDTASGTTPTAFYYTFFIAIKRVEQGFTTSIPLQLLERVYDEKDFLLLHSLAKDIQNIFGVRLPEEEFAWIYLVTICNRTFNYERFEMNFYNQYNIWPEIESITEEYVKRLKINAKTSSTITTFLKSFFLSIKIKDSINPVLNKEMLDLLNGLVSSQTKNFQRNLYFLEQCNSQFLLSNKYFQDICTSLTLYSDMLIDYYAPSKSVYFLLEGNHLVYQFIRIKAIQLFGNKHSLIFVPIQTFSREKLSESSIDLIVTNYSRNISNLLSNNDYILVKEIPDERDWENIKSKINK